MNRVLLAMASTNHEVPYVYLTIYLTVFAGSCIEKRTHDDPSLLLLVLSDLALRHRKMVFSHLHQ